MKKHYENKKKSSKGLKTEFSISFSSEDIQLRVNSKLSEIASSARIPGFRPGKIPISVLSWHSDKRMGVMISKTK